MSVVRSDMMGFREFYEALYRDQSSCVTTADEMRGVVCAYKAYRRYQGLHRELDNAEREAFFAERMEYHIGACELAELSGNAARTIKHREAFLEVWKLWFGEISGEEGDPFSCGRPPAFWEYICQNIKKWGQFKEPGG